MFFRIALASATSVYRQVGEQIKYAIATGALAPGDRLPPIRDVAAQTRVNRNTIAKAYSELEREGVIFSRPGQGSFVADGGSSIQKQQRVRILEGIVRDLYVQAFHFQITNDELRSIVERVENQFSREQHS